ncbi:MAG TPA: hypothetical protein RMH85_32960 [Polyangiaceae bacterium LLY-WYZ-15_(1-7)]|nr:hypothetical protein [Myxococcales bacterium]MAT30054.1 hypothetical protein [Sandaracinus sp.]HJL00074.1 hypothetical protein [Polyangiaceae bacterium LLY-WYZ-15_(1-7)]HJL13339.1 hypothetical protein [Polyangiaceae bacterium LLY-WYZ-15_(1-7)]HJL22396.1 hypothetical protein [Polyangiaceae bacterium LLY-WYZ-15_(1-7)]
MRPLLAALPFLVAACGPSEACREGCARFGVDPGSARCRELCTEDCATLARTYGVSERACHELQGDRGLRGSGSRMDLTRQTRPRSARGEP